MMIQDTSIRHSVMAAALMFAVLLLATTPAHAFGTDPSGRELKRYVEQYLQNAMPHDALAAKIKSSGGADSATVYEWLCSLEVNNTLSVGYSVWEARYEADEAYQAKYPKSQFIPLNITNYCINYSNSCGHWQWDKDCMKRKLGN